MYSRDLIQKIRDLYKKHKNYHKVAKLMRMRSSTVYYMVKNDYLRRKKKSGPKKNLMDREERLIKREVKRLQDKKEKITARKIRKGCNINLSIRTVERAMKDLGLKYGKIPKKLPLQPKHKKMRAELAEKWILENQITKNVVFTDEKRFSFDGPDNWFSWYDPFNPPARIKRQMGGGSLMVWGATLPSGELFVVRLDGKVNSTVFTRMLDTNVTPLLNSKYGQGGFFFQQDNCSVHVSKETKKYLNRKKFKLLDWIAYSPDMNIQENVWGMISEKVYDGKQFFSKEILWKSIQSAVDEINHNEQDKIKTLYDKYNKRLLNVIVKNGDVIPY